MILIRLAFLLLPFLVYDTYCYLNILDIEQGHCAFLLPTIGLLSVANAIFNNKMVVLRFTQRSSCYLLLFLLYHILAWCLTGQESNQIFQFILGTNQGILLAIIEGFSFNIILSCLKDICHSESQTITNLVWVMVFVQLLFVLACFYQLLVHHLASLSTRFFLITSTEGYYQRAGQLIAICYLLTASLFAVVVASTSKIKCKSYLGYLLLLMNVVLGSSLSQLLGSNSGLLCLVSTLFCLGVWLLTVNSMKEVNTDVNKMESNSKCFSKMMRHSISKSFVVLLFFLIVTFCLFICFDIDQSHLRIFNYGRGGNSSLESRLDILRTNFFKQFDYAPIFGNTQVEKYTGDEGRYAHSLISILTHLGIVGFALFITMFGSLFLSIRRQINYQHLLPDSSRSGVFNFYRIIMIMLYTAISLVSAFYTWSPLWFCIGLLGVTLSTDIGKVKACASHVGYIPNVIGNANVERRKASNL